MLKKFAVVLAILFALSCIGVALAQPPAPTETFLYGDLNMQIHRVTIEADGPIDSIISGNLSASYETWSPDGKSIAFINSCTLFMMDADGANQVALFKPVDGCADSPRWSTTGKRISFLFLSMQSYHLVVIDKDGTNPVDVLDRWGTIFSTFEWVTDEQLTFVIREYQKTPVQMVSSLRNGVWATIEMGPGIEKLGQFSHGMYPLDPELVEQFDIDIFPSYASETKTVDLAWNPDRTYVVVLQEGHVATIDDGGSGRTYLLYLLKYDGKNFSVVAEYINGFLPQWQPQNP